MNPHVSTLVTIVLLLVTLQEAGAQLQTNSAGGAAGGGLFGSGQSLFGGGGAGGGQAGVGAQQQFTLNEQGGSGGFVGRDSSDTGAIFEALNQSGNQFLNRLERSFSGRNRGRGSNQSTDTPPPIRVKLKLGFTPQVAAVSDSAVERLTQLVSERGFGSVRLAGRRGAVVIDGEVASEGDRRMLARLARLEPGVARVDNRLTIESTRLSEGQLPPPQE